MIEVRAACSQRASPKKDSYHRREKPGGGKVSASALEKDMGMTTRIGSARKRRTATATTVVAQRPMSSVQLPVAGALRRVPVEVAIRTRLTPGVDCSATGKRRRRPS